MQQLIPDDAGYFLDEFDGERFWARVNFHGGQPYLDDPLARLDDSAGECWTWTGGRGGSTRGWYGRFIVGGKPTPAHDLGFKEFDGKIPDGLLLDHLCRNTLCIRHDHLEPVTLAENVDRGVHGRSQRPRCVHGHEFTEENTRWRERDGKRWRECRTCIRARAHAA